MRTFTVMLAFTVAVPVLSTPLVWPFAEYDGTCPVIDKHWKSKLLKHDLLTRALEDEFVARNAPRSVIECDWVPFVYVVLLVLVFTSYLSIPQRPIVN